MRRGDRVVLVVDDYATMRRILRNLLGQIGFTHIEEAVDGAIAFEMLRERSFDLVISDWHMEPMSGLELLKAFDACAGMAPKPRIASPLFAHGGAMPEPVGAA